MGVNSSQQKSVPKLRLVSSQTHPAGARRNHGGLRVGDADLLLAVRRGERAAATALHDRVRPEVDRTLCRLLGPRDSDHEDMAQLAIIELIYTIDRYRGECSLDSWTSTLTAHVVFKQLRRRQTERRLFAAIGTADELPIASPDRPGRDIMARSAVARIVDHMKELDVNRAWTFVLHDVFGYDLRETALITGVSVSAAQTRLVRGRRELHQRIGDDPELANILEEMEVVR
jgi:RNA polymerase sigma-70 factor (ECF subfamily)